MKYFIKTFGCQMNYSDSERISSCLESHNLKKVSDAKSADLVIFNTCGVRQMAEDRAYGQIHNLKKNNPKIKIALTGCLSKRSDVQKRLESKVDLFFPIDSFGELESWLMKELRLKKKLNSKEEKDYFKISPSHNSSYSASVPIMTGCNNFCAYCVVPYARGREVSRPAKEILSEIKSLIEKGYTEIFLLGQNVNSYRDKNINFSKLLKKINDIPGNFWINFLSNHPKDITDEFIETVTKLPKVCELIHFPLQAGDDEILQKMNRKYTAEEYLKKLEKIKKGFEKNKPESLYAITSDIIVGFPGETKKQFLESAKVMRKANYDLVFFGQYSPRPGTAAAKLEDNVSKKEKSDRENYLNEILKKTTAKNNQKYLGKTIEVLIEKEKDGFFFGRTRTGKNIRLKKSSANFIGKIVKTKITKTNVWNLEGEIELPKVIVILGPTASGKSDAAIKLAQEFNGEVISADSRQVYRFMDIGSGKITPEEQKMAPHYLLDVSHPNNPFNISHFKKEAERRIEEILAKGKLPIICGGTGFWIKALIDNENYPEVKPDPELRQNLAKKSAEKLFLELKKIDPERAKNIDPKNKIRLIRAIEIAKTLGKVPGIKSEPKYEALQIGIDWPKEKLNERIKIRLDQRFVEGMTEEVQELHTKHRVSWKRLFELGLEYRYISLFLQKKLSEKEMKEKLFQEIKNYAKRQRTWFKRDKRIAWLPNNYSQIKKEVKKFIK